MNPTDTTIEPFPLDRIDWEDRRFAIESFLPCTEIEASLSRFGLLTPPWVLKTGYGRGAIVDGFKRMTCLREWGLGPVPCAVFPAETSARELWTRRLEARTFGPPPNVAEKAQIVSFLMGGSLKEELVEHFLAAFSLPRRTEVLDRWKRLANAGTGLLEAAARGSLHERAALELAAWPEISEERQVLVSMLEQLRCSASIQVEIIDRFRDISMARSQTVGELLHSYEVGCILDHPQWNHREKTLALREWLDRLRFPRLKARERYFSERISLTPPPADVSIAPPPSFEGAGWKMEIHFTDGEHLRGTLARLTSWSLSAGFAALLVPESDPGSKSGTSSPWKPHSMDG
jgi:ParB family chromosome partitioning protein